MKEYKNCEEVLQALRDGKRVATKHSHNRKICEGNIGCQHSKWLKVLYYYCNPQVNRTFAMLEDGTVVDTDIDILDFMYCTFYEYDEADIEQKSRKMTIEQIEKELGYKIEIVM